MISPNVIDLAWPVVFPFLRKSLIRAPDVHEPGYFPALLQDDSSMMLVAFIDPRYNITIGASIIQDIGKGIFVRHLAGRLPKNWTAEFDAWLENLARALNRPCLISQGRKGWTRLLKPYNWRREGDLLIKDVKGV